MRTCALMVLKFTHRAIAASPLHQYTGMSVFLGTTRTNSRLPKEMQGDTLHPTQKPVMAILPRILAYSHVGDIVLDPFAGSGTTAVTAAALGRRYIGIELEPQYARIAEERVA